MTAPGCVCLSFHPWGHPLLSSSPHHLSPYRCIAILIAREAEKKRLICLIIPLGGHSHGVRREGLFEDRGFEVAQDPGYPLRTIHTRPMSCNSLRHRGGTVFSDRVGACERLLTFFSEGLDEDSLPFQQAHQGRV